MSADDEKQRAAAAALAFVEPGMKLGLGTGSTASRFVDLLGAKVAAGLKIIGVPTSQATQRQAERLGIPLATLEETPELDLTIDGADEVDPAFNLTKGGGGAHTREKLVAQMGPRFVVVVDESKLVDRLGPFGTPLEVLDFAPRVVAARVQALGASDVTTRTRRSDNGNLLMDARFGTIADPVGLAAELAAIPGLVEHGIFPGSMVERVVVAGVAGVHELVR